MRFYADAMALHPDGINHLALATRDIKGQIEFFTDVLGGELKALYWMHGVADTFHAFVELSPTCYIAFQQHPDNPQDAIIGVTHAGNAGGQVTAGTMQHLAFNVPSLDDLYAMRDRIRSRGIPVIGPMNHGMCQSMYFAGPECLALEVACGGAIDSGHGSIPRCRRWPASTTTSSPGSCHRRRTNGQRRQCRSPSPTRRSRIPCTPSACGRPCCGRLTTKMWNAVTSEPPVSVAG